MSKPTYDPANVGKPMTLVERLRAAVVMDNDPILGTIVIETKLVTDSANEIESLQREREALRSVLSEWDQDKSCFIQWNRANDIRDQREGGKGV